MKTPKERFDAKYTVAGNGCWTWNILPAGRRYGQMFYQGMLIGAHRASWLLHKGSIPKGLYVLHKCDNPRCVNPEHLELGTQRDNMLDMHRKGRSGITGKDVCLKGDAHPNAKLSGEIVEAIRADPRSQRVLAKVYGISQSHVNRLKLKQSWSHI